MSIGTLRAHVVVHDPERVHYGSNDPVSGKVLITFQASTKAITETNAELFGPLKVSISFHGRSKTKISRKKDHTYSVFRGRVSLFSETVVIYDESFRSQPGECHEFPFSMSFPESLEPSDYEFGFVPENALPPSFCDINFGLQGQYESFIEYWMGLDVVMPGLNITIWKPDAETVIKYERPRVLQPYGDKRSQFDGVVSISNELLLPEEDRPSGFTQKAKGKAMAIFNSEYYPKYTFDWKCFGPRHLYIGQPVTFQVSIAPRENECTAITIPEIYLTSFTVEVQARTRVRAEKRFLTTPESRGQCTLTTLKGVVADTGPFSKSNDWTKSVVTESVAGIPSTFTTVNISRSYSLQVRLGFKLAGKHRDSGESYEVFIHPPLQTGDPGSAVAGSSTQPITAEGIGDPTSTLPPYEHPPEYGEASERA